MKKQVRINMTEGNVATILRRLTVPMILGVFGLVAFNLADTYFVGSLGTIQIAALTFTFPVVLVLNSLVLGIGIGASAVISRAVGEQNRVKVVRLSTDSLTLGFLISILAIIIGELTIEPLFRAIGADDTTLPYIIQYMRIWYAGLPFVTIPMIGNNAIRALGDTKTPSMVMLIAAGVNIVLDPLFIFGIWFFPELGVAGAALATVISRFTTFSVALYILIIREKVISLKLISMKTMLTSWKSILYIGFPNSIARIILPLGAGIVTKMIASYGVDAIAGYGIATKLEYFFLGVLQALASVMPVFVGQNYGAHKIERIKEAFKLSKKFSLIYGVFIYCVLLLISRPLASVFTQSLEVQDTIVLYLRIVPIAYGLQGILLVTIGSLNALGHPLNAASINLIQMLVIYIPTAMLLSSFIGIYGIFIALVISYLLVSLIANLIISKRLNDLI